MNDRNFVNRREFIGVALGAAAAVAMPSLLKAQSPTGEATLTVYPNQEIGRIPDNFTGLSYESSQLADPNFFAPANKALVGMVRRLGVKGVLRIGGNTSEYAVWSPQGATVPVPSGVGSPDTGGKVHRQTATTPKAIDHLAGFLDSTGWQLIYGVNLGTGTPEAAADEAAYVWKAARRHLLAFQIGNEPDLFSNNGLRSATYGFSDYFAEWQRFALAIRARVKDAPLAGPDVAYKVDWVESFAKAAAGMASLLTGHYYAEGPPSNPAMNIDRLLSPNPRLLKSMAGFMQASRDSHLPYRMAEGNSCYGGGKPGVSDTFASALWGGDYMLQAAQAGYVGVNFHGGGQGWYTPIATTDDGLLARPLYYGMLLAGHFAGARMVQADFDAQDSNVTAYACTAKDQMLIALFNKDQQSSLQVSIDCGQPVQSANLWRLTAPTLDSTKGVTLAGAEVGADGHWDAAKVESAPIAGGRVSVDLPPASAALVFIH
jgi:hypothetical protein